MLKNFKKTGMKETGILLVAFLLTLASNVEAGDTLKLNPKTRISFGLSAWISSGQTDLNHDASLTSVLLGNPTSELIYEDIDSNIIQLEVELKFSEGYYLRGNYGFGFIGDGQLIDDDYLSPTGALIFSTNERFSRTHSNIDNDNVWYLNIDVGRQIIKSRRGRVWGFIGYQHWAEKISARGITMIECPNIILCDPPGTISNEDENVIANDASWNSLKVGLDLEYKINRSISFSGRFAYIPYAFLKNEDVHYLRTDLQQNPSFEMKGNGSGYNLEVAAKTRVVGSLYFEVGFRYWHLMVKDGDWKNNPVSGDNKIANLNDFNSDRFGAMLGLSYKF